MTSQELFSMLACDGFYFAHDEFAEETMLRRMGADTDDADRAEYEELLDLGLTLRAR